MKLIRFLILGLGILSLSSRLLAQDKGKELFDKLCMTCHGAEGKGDGPAAAALPPNMKPANMQAGKFKVVDSDAKMKEVIHKGGMAFGLSPVMPAQPTLKDEELDLLVKYVRSLKK